MARSPDAASGDDEGRHHKQHKHGKKEHKIEKKRKVGPRMSVCVCCFSYAPVGALLLSAL